MSIRLTHLFTSVLLLLSCTLANAVQFNNNAYDVLLGDANGDGNSEDIVLVGKEQLILIAASITIPIIIPPQQSYVLHQLDDGKYASPIAVNLQDIDTTALVTPAAGQYNYNDINGDGQSDFTFNAATGNPVILTNSVSNLVVMLANGGGFSESSHDLYVNSEGDIYIKAHSSIVLIHDDIITPILIPPTALSYFLNRNTSTSFWYDPAVAYNETNSPIDISAYTLYSGLSVDTSGDLVIPSVANIPGAFTIATDLSYGSYSGGSANGLAVQNPQLIWDDILDSFILTWTPPSESVTQYFVYFSTEIREQSPINSDVEAVYGSEIELSWSCCDESEQYLAANAMQFIIPASTPYHGYGIDGYIEIRAENAQSQGPTTRVEIERVLTPALPTPTNLSYEMRTDELIAHFSWATPVVSNLPAGANIYYKIEYISDTGVPQTRYYTSNFAALDLTDDAYWDYSVSTCVAAYCGSPATIRAQLITQQISITETGFEPGMPVDWIANGWTANSAQTSTGNTGPGNAASGVRYAYFETSSPVSNGDIATLESPSFNPNNSRLRFSYHMYGASMGGLYVDIYEDGWNTIWQRVGQQHTGLYAPWTEVEIDLSAYASDTKIRFRGVDGNGNLSDMALDDIQITAAFNVIIQGLKAEYSSYPHGLKISWDEYSEGAINYEVARSTDAGVNWEYNYYVGTNEEFVDQDIDDTSRTYTYKVRACNSDSCSEWTPTPSAQ